MVALIDAAAARHPVPDGWAPTADETCPRCGAPTRYRLGEDDSGHCIEAELCVSCGWLAEYDDNYHDECTRGGAW